MDDPPAGNFGRSAAQAAAAALYLELAMVVGVVEVEVLELLGLLGSVTPCSFRQLRYAAKAVLLAPPKPPKPPKPPVVFGRRLLQAAAAALNLGLSNREAKAPPPEGKLPEGKLPEGKLPEGKLPEGMLPPLPGARIGNETPWLFRHDVYAANDDEPPEPAAAVLVGDDAPDEPHAASSIAPTATVATSAMVRRPAKRRRARPLGDVSSVALPGLLAVRWLAMAMWLLLVDGLVDDLSVAPVRQLGGSA